MKSIIDDWTKELQSHSKAFVEDAQKLADWDKHIRLKRRELLQMEANLDRVRCLPQQLFPPGLLFMPRFATMNMHMHHSVSTLVGDHLLPFMLLKAPC